MIDEKSSDAKLLEVLHEGGLGPKQAECLRGRVQWFKGYAFGRIAQHSLSTLEEVSLKKRKYVPSLATSVPLWSFLSYMTYLNFNVILEPVFGSQRVHCFRIL